MKSLTTILLFICLTGPAFAHTCHDTATTSDDIQDLLDDLDALGPNRTLCLSEGTYDIDTEIEMYDGQQLLGTTTGNQAADKEDVVLRATNTSSTFKILKIKDDVRVAHMTFTSDTGAYAKHAIYTGASGGAEDSTIWNIEVLDIDKPIALYNSDGASIKTSFFTDTGEAGDCEPDQAIWFKNSDDVVIWYGKVDNRADGVPYRDCTGNPSDPGYLDGDGAIACHESTGLMVTGTKSKETGAAAFYLVDCDNAGFVNVEIEDSDGFGLDVPRSSDDLYVDSIDISGGGRPAVYLGVGNGSQPSDNAEIEDSTFTDNNDDNLSVFCQGINADSSLTVTVSGNTASPADGDNSPTFDFCTF